MNNYPTLDSKDLVKVARKRIKYKKDDGQVKYYIIEKEIERTEADLKAIVQDGGYRHFKVDSILEEYCIQYAEYPVNSSYLGDPNEIYYNLPESTLSLIKTALEAGLEHTRTALAEHDRSLDRTTRKNKLWALTLEKDIENLEESLKLLPISVERLE